MNYCKSSEIRINKKSRIIITIKRSCDHTNKRKMVIDIKIFSPVNMSRELHFFFLSLIRTSQKEAICSKDDYKIV